MGLKKDNPKTINRKENVEKPPKVFIFIFALFVILASVNLMNDLGALGSIKPFGFVDSAWAAVRKITGEPAPNRREIVSRLVTVGDVNESLDRCEIIDPNLSKIVTAAAYKSITNLKPKGLSPGGLNQAIVLDGGADGVPAQLARAEDLGFSYILGMVTNPTGLNGAIDFVNQSIGAELIPVVRLCFANVQGCDPYFKEQNNIVAFYTALAEGASGPFVAMIGANEPGTGDDGSAGAQKEFYGFVDDAGSLSATYDALVQETNAIAASLQNLRGQGLLLISPGAFNLTNSESNDVAEMLYRGRTLDLGLYDVLMGNTYEVGAQTGYGYYENGATGNPAESLKAAVDSAGGEIQTIITEFGIIRDLAPPLPVQLTNAKTSFEKFCEDENVQGVMFFRAVEDLPETQPKHALTDEQIFEIIGDCVTPIPELPDFAWANCPLETYTYDDKYSKKSTASICGKNEEADKGEGYFLQADCEGDSCVVKRQDTVTVKMPIRQFGSISASGAPFFDYTPISVDLVRFPGLTSIDPVTGGQLSNDSINQFAGKLTSDSGTYNMPWLGNAINASSQLIKADTTFINDNETLQVGINASTGSNLEEKQKDVKFDEENPPAYATPQNQAYAAKLEEIGLTDELGLCLNNPLLCANTGDSLYLEDLRRNYRPYDVLARYQPARECSASSLSIRAESYNYIEGPEIKVGDVSEESYPAGDVCADFVSRSTGTNPEPQFIFEDTKGISCSYNSRGDVAISGFDKVPGVPLTCADLPTQNFAYISGTGFQASLDGLKRCAGGGSVFDDSFTSSGKCDISPSISGCFDLKTRQATVINSEGEEEIAGEVYLAKYPTSEIYRSVDDYKIPGIYDSLYWMYKRNLLTMEGMGKRIVAKDNIGWAVQVSSNVRDANREIDKGSDFSNAGEAEMKYKYGLQTNASNLFQNEYYYAKGDPNEVENHYYDWLGYVDILQEISTVYLVESVLPTTSPIPAEEFWEDSLVSLGDLPEVLTEKMYLNDVPLRMEYDDKGNVVTTLDSRRLDPEAYFTDYDLALKAMRYPMFTCDVVLEAQIAFLKTQGFNVRNSGMKGLNDLIDEYGIPNPTCISLNDDTNFDIWSQDGLANFLCAKGYTELCFREVQCYETDDVDEYDDLADLEIGEVDFASCPVRQSHACFQGPYGDYSHCNSTGLPIDLYPAFVGNGTYERDYRVRAPESGTIIASRDYSNTQGGSQGFNVVIQGDTSGVYYSISHLAEMTPPPGTKVSEGEIIGQICTTTCTYGYANAHTHLNAFLSWNSENGVGSQFIDPYLIFGKLLGCNATPPVSGQEQYSTPVAGQCRSTSKGFQDNGSCLNSKAPPVSTQTVLDRFGAEPEEDPQVPDSSPTGGSTDNPSGSLICIDPDQVEDEQTEFKKGVLNCSIDTRDETDTLDFDKYKPLWEVLIKSYNLDDNDSYTWLAVPASEGGESSEVKNAVVDYFGGYEPAYQNDYNDRVEVVNHVRQAIRDVNNDPDHNVTLSETFVFTLWIEESGGSALGRAAMGCLGFRSGNTTFDAETISEMPVGRNNKEATKEHLAQQVRCLASYIEEFEDFEQFMCTYSGEVGRPDCDTQNFQSNPNFPGNVCRYYNYR